MEFDEMKKIWDLQTKEPLYAINEKALHSHIQSKKKKAHHITNFSELLIIITNSTAGSFILGFNYIRQTETIGMYLLAAWMFGSALYCFISRVRRIQEQSRFNQSMRGDLDNAVAIATYQVRLSHLMRWNILPIGTFVLLGVWEGGKSIWVAVAILIFFVLTHFAAGWEHNIYNNRKRALEALRNKLTGTEPSEHLS